MKLNLKIMTVLILGGGIISASDALACRASRDLKHNFFVTYENQTAIKPFGDGPGSTILPQAIDQCRTSAGKYLMFSKGVFLPGIVSDVADISFDGVLQPETCRIENPLFSQDMKIDQRKSLVAENHKFLSQCTFIDVAEMNGRQLVYENQQKSCKVTEIAKGIIRLEGDYCFLSINPNYLLSVQMGIKPECANPEKLKSLGITLRDIEASMNTYVTGDATGLSTDVDPIGSSRYRFSLQPHSKMTPLSEDLSEDDPRFPSTYSVEVNMGNLTITQVSEQRLALDLSLSVEQVTKKVCYDGLCTAPAEYGVPVVADVEIYDVTKSGTRTFVDEWMVGGVVVGGWKGLFRTQQHFIDEHVFIPGKRYEMVVTMYDPYEDFQVYLKRAEQFLIDLRSANGVAGLDQIEPLSPLGQLIGLPYMSGLPGINSSDINGDMERVLRFFKKLGSDRQWPVFYSQLCDPSHGTCYQAGKRKFWNKLTTRFGVEKVDSTGVQKLVNVNVSKQSPDKSIYSKNVPALPKYTCE